MLDLINLGGNGGERHRRTGGNSSAGSRPVSSRERKDTSPEARSAQAFFDALNTLNFDPSEFGLIFSRASLPVQERAIECLIEIIDTLSFKYDEGYAETNDEFEVYSKAKRVQDAMIAFRRAGML